ncbi:MAG: TonB C-terminal domain-containing protein [Myxococcales bacterium]|nr:TonB C-terminal domain-containing protein [Myxococcales bacterium]MCB9642395.1 TonB C-terminal domain-containing protein [Myxococcales bacterium]
MSQKRSFRALTPCWQTTTLVLCGFVFLFSLQVHAETKESTSPLLLTARYLARVHDRIQKSWETQKLPLMALHKRSATVTVWIDAKGKLKKIKIVQSSGLKSFDHSLLKAIYKSSPFEKPHPSILEDVQKTGLDIVFRKRVFKRKLKPLKLEYKGKTTVPNWTPGKPQKR